MCKTLHIPHNDPRIQQLDPFDLSFIEWSIICDDPKLLEQIKNRYNDPDFDNWVEEFDKEQQNKKSVSPDVEMPDTETVEWSAKKTSTPHLPTEEYEMGDTSQFNDTDWEREE